MKLQKLEEALSALPRKAGLLSAMPCEGLLLCSPGSGSTTCRAVLSPLHLDLQISQGRGCLSEIDDSTWLHEEPLMSLGGFRLLLQWHFGAFLTSSSMSTQDCSLCGATSTAQPLQHSPEACVAAGQHVPPERGWCRDEQSQHSGTGKRHSRLSAQKLL